MQNMATVEDNYVEMFPHDDTTGLLLHNHYLPEEMLTNILGFVDPDTLLQCRRVCKHWRYMIDTEVWKLKIKCEESLSSLACMNINSLSASSWIDLYWICKKHPFGRNLLNNNCGQDIKKHWKILSNGGDKWAIENPPIGADPLPTTIDELHPNFCFATSYQSCSKQQVINLKAEGLTSAFMDKIQPVIQVGDWYAGRFDCGCVYEMKVRLLKTDRKEAVADFQFRDTITQWQGGEWHKVEHVFKDYGPGVQYIEFYHGGMDTQFWAGHFGSKMTGAVVKIEVADS